MPRSKSRVQIPSPAPVFCFALAQPFLGRGTQVVRERSAKPLYVSSILTRASNSFVSRNLNSRSTRRVVRFLEPLYISCGNPFASRSLQIEHAPTWASFEQDSTIVIVRQAVEIEPKTLAPDLGDHFRIADHLVMTTFRTTENTIEPLPSAAGMATEGFTTPCDACHSELLVKDLYNVGRNWSQVRILRQLATMLLLFVLFGYPAMACLTRDTEMTAAERECCTRMAHQCGAMNMPASHSCCKTEVRRPNSMLRVASAHLVPPAASERVASDLATPPVSHDEFSVFELHALPESPPESSSVLRI